MPRGGHQRRLHAGAARHDVQVGGQLSARPLPGHRRLMRMSLTTSATLSPPFMPSSLHRPPCILPPPSPLPDHRCIVRTSKKLGSKLAHLSITTSHANPPPPLARPTYCLVAGALYSPLLNSAQSCWPLSQPSTPSPLLRPPLHPPSHPATPSPQVHRPHILKAWCKAAALRHHLPRQAPSSTHPAHCPSPSRCLVTGASYAPP